MTKTLNLIAGSFAAAGVVAVVVLSAVDLGEPESPDLADGAALAAAIFGVVGLLLALQWWSRSGEATRTAASAHMGFIIRVAIAELGVLIGIVGVVMTGSITPAVIGLALFLTSLALLTAGLRQIPEA